MDTTSLGDRMKSYEKITDHRIIERIPIIIRIDGKNFNKLTKRFEKPFSDRFSRWMVHAMAYTASKLQGCVIGYTQSDEITFVIHSDQSLESTSWCGNRIQKILSITSSFVTLSFNDIMWRDLEGLKPFAVFDCKIFAVPNITEAANCLVWIQNDCVKNSINAATYYEISKKYGRGKTRKMMHGLNQKEQQELLFKLTSINWSNYDEKYKNGIVTIKQDVKITTKNGEAIRKRWVVKSAPRFTSEEGKEWLYGIIDPKEE